MTLPGWVPDEPIGESCDEKARRDPAGPCGEAKLAAWGDAVAGLVFLAWQVHPAQQGAESPWWQPPHPKPLPQDFSFSNQTVSTHGFFFAKVATVGVNSTV